MGKNGSCRGFETRTELAATRRRGHLYGRRKGPRLSPRQQALRIELLPRLRLKPETGYDPGSYFDTKVSDTWLEVGFGSGEHMLLQAGAHPHVGIIGAEPYEAGVAKTLSKLADDHNLLERVRIYQGDARDVIDALPADCLGRVFILFPDPWPKTRHHKRRFIQMEMLDRLAIVMKPGAELRFASDDQGYVCWTLERFTAHPAFSWQAERALDWSSRPHDWPQTRYEKKALHGPPAYFSFFRRKPGIA